MCCLNLAMVAPKPPLLRLLKAIWRAGKTALAVRGWCWHGDTAVGWGFGGVRGEVLVWWCGRQHAAHAQDGAPRRRHGHRPRERSQSGRYQPVEGLITSECVYICVWACVGVYLSFPLPPPFTRLTCRREMPLSRSMASRRQGPLRPSSSSALQRDAPASANSRGAFGVGGRGGRARKSGARPPPWRPAMHSRTRPPLYLQPPPPSPRRHPLSSPLQKPR
jgi:hypothetical protein